MAEKIVEQKQLVSGSIWKIGKAAQKKNVKDNINDFMVIINLIFN